MNEINAFHMVPRACVVCRHQWKRCDESCIFTRYFPSERAEDFLNMHRLFRIQNTTKILNSVVENERDKTIESLILEARIRKENPVHGPVEVQRRLQAEIEQVKKELDTIKKQVQFFREKSKFWFSKRWRRWMSKRIDLRPNNLLRNMTFGFQRILMTNFDNVVRGNLNR
ncbi:hypothetical protein Pfo_000297 [Paulownia fortunei]|nr:hypothetical protein Pfo_000297 [Paulownia fortunei]